MNRSVPSIISACGLALCAGHALAQSCTPRPPIGPDVIVGQLRGDSATSSLNTLSPPANYTPGTTGFDVGYDAFSMGTTSCNLGNAPVMWYNQNDVTPSMPDIGNKHPAIAQAFYKYSSVDGAGRFEQLGQSWLKHGFLALSQGECCNDCVATDGNTLGVGCSDPYTATRNGGQVTSTTGAGPKFQVNAATGVYPWPMPTSGQPTFTGTIRTFRRLRIPVAELVASTGGPTAAVRYFGEGQYVTWDDAQAGNKNNNASIREMQVSQISSSNFDFLWYTSGTYADTHRKKSAIRVWKELDPRVLQVDVNVPNDGLLVVSSRAFRLTGGMWRYEYAVYNMNSDRSVGSFMIPAADSLSVSNIGFHDVQYHSGDGVSSTGTFYSNYDGTDWPGNKASGGLTWACTPYATHQGANAIRWGTTYNFRVDTIAQPSFQSPVGTLGLFKPPTGGDPTSMTAAIIGPAAPGDSDELFAFLDLWFAYNTLAVTTDSMRLVDLNADNFIDSDDLFLFLDVWFANS
jgi:hypothetical protein